MTVRLLVGLCVNPPQTINCHAVSYTHLWSTQEESSRYWWSVNFLCWLYSHLNTSAAIGILAIQFDTVMHSPQRMNRKQRKRISWPFSWWNRHLKIGNMTNYFLISHSFKIDVFGYFEWNTCGWYCWGGGERGKPGRADGEIVSRCVGGCARVSGETERRESLRTSGGWKEKGNEGCSENEEPGFLFNRELPLTSCCWFRTVASQIGYFCW